MFSEGLFRRLAHQAKRGEDAVLGTGRLSVGLQHLVPQPECGVHPEWQLRQLRELNRAFRLTSSGFEVVWKKDQTTTEWATLIGPKKRRVGVGAEIPLDEITGENQCDRVVFRDAATGRLLAFSETRPFMTQGSAVQPGYDGSVFFPGGEGTLVKVTPPPVMLRR